MQSASTYPGVHRAAGRTFFVQHSSLSAARCSRHPLCDALVFHRFTGLHVLMRRISAFVGGGALSAFVLRALSTSIMLQVSVSSFLRTPQRATSSASRHRIPFLDEIGVFLTQPDVPHAQGICDFSCCSLRRSSEGRCDFSACRGQTGAFRQYVLPFLPLHVSMPNQQCIPFLLRSACFQVFLGAPRRSVDSLSGVCHGFPRVSEVAPISLGRCSSRRAT